MTYKPHILGMIAIMIYSAMLYSKTPVGHWMTFDEGNGDTLSIVEIYEVDGMLSGRIARVFLRPHQGEDGVCQRCEDELHMTKITGLSILADFRKKAGGWDGGRILDPASGKAHKASARLANPQELHIQISAGPFGLFKKTRVLKRMAAKENLNGIWKMYEDRFQQVQAIVEINETADSFSGRIIETRLLPDEGPEAVCIECPDSLKGRPLQGLEILKGLYWQDRKWQGGSILDPGNGKTYRCSLELEGHDRLRVRGHLGPFSRSQVWHRVQAIKGASSQSR